MVAQDQQSPPQTQATEFLSEFFSDGMIARYELSLAMFPCITFEMRQAIPVALGCWQIQDIRLT